MCESKSINPFCDEVEKAIVDLSVHPAHCEDWTFYESLCIEVAGRLGDALESFRANNKDEARF